MADILPTTDELFGPAPAALPTTDELFGVAPQAPAPAPIYHSPKSYPAAVNARIEQGVNINDLFKAGAEGVKAGWNNPDIPPSVSGLQSWVDKNVNVGPLRLFNQALTNPAVGAYDLLAKGLSAVMGGLQGAGAETGQQIGKVTGQPLLGNDLSALFSEYPGAELAGMAPHISRVEVDPATGIMRDGHIGPIPHPTEVPGQAKGIEQIYFGPQVPEAANTNEVGKAVTSLPNVSPETFKSLAEEANLREKHHAIIVQFENLPEGDPSAVDRLARLDAVETQLKDENLTAPDRKALNDRRDQILVDTTPEKLKEAAAPIEQRRALEAQQASIEQRLGELADTHAKALEEAALSPLPKQTPAQLIERLYHEDGVLPAEVHRDAQLDPTVIADLAIGEKPARYARPDPHLNDVLNARLNAVEPGNTNAAAAVLSSEQAAVDRRLGSDAILKDAIEQEDSLGQLPGVYTQEGPGAAGRAATDAGKQPETASGERPIAGAGDTASATLEQGGGATRVAGRQERVVSAAVRVGDQTFTGQTHADAVNAALKAGIPEAEIYKSTHLNGFVTSDGRYVGREEALKIAKAADQAPGEALGGAIAQGEIGDRAKWLPAQKAGRSQLLKPIKGTGSLETRGLSEHIDEAATERGLTEGFGDLPQYRTVNMAEQSRLANDLLARDPQLAMDIAMGRKPAPPGMAPEAALVAVEKAATAAGDAGTLRDLTNTRLATDATTMGQRLRVLGERDPNSVVGAMRMVNDAREAKIKPYLIAKEIKQVTKDAGKAIRSAAPKMDAWAAFLQEIECK